MEICFLKKGHSKISDPPKSAPSLSQCIRPMYMYTVWSKLWPVWSKHHIAGLVKTVASFGQNITLPVWLKHYIATLVKTVDSLIKTLHCLFGQNVTLLV